MDKACSRESPRIHWRNAAFTSCNLAEAKGFIQLFKMLQNQFTFLIPRHSSDPNQEIFGGSGGLIMTCDISLTNRYLHWGTSSTQRDQPGPCFWKGKPQAVTCTLPHRMLLVQHRQWSYYKTSVFVSCACWHPCAPSYCMAPGGISDMLPHAKMQNISSSSWTITLMEKVMKCS